MNKKMKSNDNFQKNKLNEELYLNIKSTTQFKKYIDYLYDYLERNAKKRNIDVKITINDIIEKYENQKVICVYTGNIMTLDDKKNHNPNNISVDRIDSTKPYTKDNIQLVCSIVNKMKYDLTHDQFVEMIFAVTKQYNKSIEEKYRN